MAACRDTQTAGTCKAHAQLQDFRTRGESPKKPRDRMCVLPGHSDMDSSHVHWNRGDGFTCTYDKSSTGVKARGPSGYVVTLKPAPLPHPGTSWQDSALLLLLPCQPSTSSPRACFTSLFPLESADSQAIIMLLCFDVLIVLSPPLSPKPPPGSRQRHLPFRVPLQEPSFLSLTELLSWKSFLLSIFLKGFKKASPLLYHHSSNQPHHSSSPSTPQPQQLHESPSPTAPPNPREYLGPNTRDRFQTPLG